jgi:hypothetical protein
MPMARHPLKFKPSLAEQRRLAQDALDWWRGLSIKPDAPRLDTGAKPKRERTGAGKPLERDVLNAVRDYLRAHPLVAWVGRINRGAATDSAGHFVQFNSIAGCSDLIGQLKSGQFLACEVKRPGQKPTPAQYDFLAMVQSNGGCAGWADSVEMAQGMMTHWVSNK